MPRPGPDWSVSPLEWGARVDYDAWDDPYSPDDGIAIHHGGSGDYAAHNEPYYEGKEMAQLRSWERFHIDERGWRGIAYGWGLGQSGTVYRLRGWNRYGAHLGDHDGDGIANNEEIIPILFIGSGNHTGLSFAAESSLVRLRAYLEEVRGRNLTLYGHQEIQPKPTACPGPLLMEYVVSHRELEDEEVITRNSKADEGMAQLAENFETLKAAGVFSNSTQPGGVTFNDEFGTFLLRFEAYLRDKYGLGAEGLSKAEVVALIESANLDVPAN